MLEPDGPTWIRNCLEARGFKTDICKVRLLWHLLNKTEACILRSFVSGLPHGLLTFAHVRGTVGVFVIHTY